MELYTNERDIQEELILIEIKLEKLGYQKETKQLDHKLLTFSFHQ